MQLWRNETFHVFGMAFLCDRIVPSIYAYHFIVILQYRDASLRNQTSILGGVKLILIADINLVIILTCTQAAIIKVRCYFMFMYTTYKKGTMLVSHKPKNQSIYQS